MLVKYLNLTTVVSMLCLFYSTARGHICVLCISLPLIGAIWNGCILCMHSILHIGMNVDNIMIEIEMYDAGQQGIRFHFI